MTSPTRQTILAYLAGTFVLGAVAGGALGYGWGRRPVFRSFDRDEMRTRLCDSLVNDLQLTSSQREQLDPIIKKNMEEFEAVHRDHFSQIASLLKRHREKVAEILDPSQRAKFELMEQERDRRMPKRRGSPGGPPSTGPTRHNN